MQNPHIFLAEFMQNPHRTVWRFGGFSLGDLAESCLEDVSKYLDFIRYQYVQTTTATLVEFNVEFEASMQQGFDDMKAGRITPLKEAFAKIKSQFA